MYSKGQWAKVCDDGSWDDVDSKVLCKSLGFDPNGALYKSFAIQGDPGLKTNWLGNVTCNGSEDTLMKCLSESNYTITCPQRRYIVIKCSASK